MTHPKITLPTIAHHFRSFRASAALILATLVLMIAMATNLATAQTYSDLHDFDGLHGYSPIGTLVQGRNGDLYGSAWGGTSSEGLGIMFRITPSGTITVLRNLDYDGWLDRMTLGTDGNYYGTAEENSTFFKMTPAGSMTVLHRFVFDTEGQPDSAPTQGVDGNFYFTTWGSAHKITPSGTLTQLTSQVPGGSVASLLLTADGAFYGTTAVGGSRHCAKNDDFWNCGTVFKVTPAGLVTTLFNFDRTHGEFPGAPVIQGRDGNFYGTTKKGGSARKGVVFKLTPQGAITLLHNFADPNYPNDGISTEAGLIQATDGNFYGVTPIGGTLGYGVIFRITQAGAYSILYNFDHAHGSTPLASLMQHTNGKIYGLTYDGGPSNNGVAFTLDLSLGPFISLVSTTGKVGSQAEILGGGLTGASQVEFNGTPAIFKVWSDTYLTATVPNGATTGSVTVTTAASTLMSNHEFWVRPEILTVAPASGAVGVPVVITGTSFTQTTKVTFGGGKAAASFTVDSDTQVTATVPPGAPTGYIVLTTAGGKARSPDTFAVTP